MSDLIERLRTRASGLDFLGCDDMFEAADALERMQWNHDMEAAPKDGTRILAVFEGVDRAILIQWNGAGWNTLDGNDWMGRNIIYWMHLPTPPE